MTRLLMISGKGGVGKTTVAGATGLACAERGYRTLVLSFDLAHSLADSFDLGRGLHDHNQGAPLPVSSNLDIQELDVEHEIRNHWSEINSYTALLLSSTGLNRLVAEETSILPGTEDVIALMYINQYVREKRYAVLVVDAPPTAESLRFVNLSATLEWYMRKRFNFDRSVSGLVRPLAKRFTDTPLPESSYFDTLQTLFDRLDGIRDTLLNPNITSVRLVTGPEKMIIRETQRAFMYFNLFGMSTDMVVANRVIPAVDGYFARWSEVQRGYVAQIRDLFQPVPVVELPMFAEEVIGPQRLAQMAEALYADKDPASFLIDAPTQQFTKDGDTYQLRLMLPFADKSAVELSPGPDELVVQIGQHRRHVMLPRSFSGLKPVGAKLADNELVVRFAPPGSQSA